jgi:hypothetical protein
MDLNKLIPEHKFDTEKVELLNNLTFEEIEPIIRNLLEWLQDGNWPVSRPLGKYLKTLPPAKLGPYLMEILNGNDYDWKYFLIAILGDQVNGVQYQPFHNEISRIANDPTEIEKKCELDDIAKLMIE